MKPQSTLLVVFLLMKQSVFCLAGKFDRPRILIPFLKHPKPGFQLGHSFCALEFCARLSDKSPIHLSVCWVDS